MYSENDNLLNSVKKMLRAENRTPLYQRSSVLSGEANHINSGVMSFELHQA